MEGGREGSWAGGGGGGGAGGAQDMTDIKLFRGHKTVAN